MAGEQRGKSRLVLAPDRKFVKEVAFTHVYKPVLKIQGVVNQSHADPIFFLFV